MGKDQLQYFHAFQRKKKNKQKKCLLEKWWHPNILVTISCGLFDPGVFTKYPHIKSECACNAMDIGSESRTGGWISSSNWHASIQIEKSYITLTPASRHQFFHFDNITCLWEYKQNSDRDWPRMDYVRSSCLICTYG